MTWDEFLIQIQSKARQDKSSQPDEQCIYVYIHTLACAQSVIRHTFFSAGGDTIRQVQVQSGAHVELHRGDHPDPSEKLFNIRGTPDQIQMAEQLIRQRYENLPGGGSTSPYGYVVYVTVYGKRDHVPQKLIFSYGLQRHLRKTLAKLRFLAYNDVLVILEHG